MAFVSGARAQTVARERRRSERRRVLFGSWLITPDGAICVKCQTRDVSPEGARIFVSGQTRLPKSLYFVNLYDRLAYEAITVWQRSPEIGLSFRRAYRLDELSAPLDTTIMGLVA
jgi:hypothetical protein